MIKSQFIKWHSWALGLSLVYVLISFFITALEPFLGFTALTIFMFLVIAGLFYFLSVHFIDHSNKQLFGNIILASTFLKIMLSIAMMGGYYYLYQPQSKLFILPFFVIYFIFTTFETIFLVKINLNGKKG